MGTLSDFYNRLRATAEKKKKLDDDLRSGKIRLARHLDGRTEEEIAAANRRAGIAPSLASSVEEEARLRGITVAELTRRLLAR